MLTTVEVLEQLDRSPEVKKSQSLTQKLKTTLTNISYSIKNSQFVHMPFLTRPTIQIQQNSYSMAYLMGRAFSYQTRVGFQEIFVNTIWMSYRKVNDQGDVGWGCMIRVVQMVFAEVLKRCLKQVTVNELIQLFKEESNGALSLSKICKFGSIQKRFTSSPEIYGIMTSLVQPIKQRMKFNLTIDNFCSMVKIGDQKQYSEKQFPKLISISAEAGDQGHLSQDYMSHLLSMIRDPSFCGMAAGVGNEALFIVGEYKEVAIILDPHYVQTSQKEETFFEKVPKGIEFSKLKPTFTINFYFQNFEEFGQWVDNVMLMERVMKPYTCFSAEVKNPEKWTINHRKKSEDFELLL